MKTVYSITPEEIEKTLQEHGVLLSAGGEFVFIREGEIVGINLLTLVQKLEDHDRFKRALWCIIRHSSEALGEML